VPALKLYLRRTTNNAPAIVTEQSAALPVGTVSSPAFVIHDLSVNLGAVQAALTVTHTHPADTTHRDGCIRAFASANLAALTIAAGTWRVGLSGTESNAAADTYWNIAVYVWRPSTGTKVGTIYDAHDGTAFSSEISDGRQIISFSGAALAVQAGDILMFEVWHHWQHTMATAYTSNLKYDDGTELDDVAAAEGSWIECPQDDIFGAAGSTITFDASIAGSAAVAAQADMTRALTVAVAGSGAVAAQADETKALAASIAGAASLTAQADEIRALEVVIAGVGAVAADITVTGSGSTITFDISVNAGADVAPALAATRALAASISGQAALTAQADETRSLAVAITGQAALSASVARTVALEALLAGTATIVSSPVLANVVFQAVIAGQATVVTALDGIAGVTAVVDVTNHQVFILTRPH
jgi:hypothetical protein